MKYLEKEALSVVGVVFGYCVVSPRPELVDELADRQ